MSRENLELLERIYRRWGQGDFEPDPSMGEDFTLAMGPEFPDTGVYTGRESVASYMAQFLEPWDKLTIEAEEMVDGDGKVLVSVLQSGAGTASGIAVELRYFQLWTFDDGRPVRMETIRDEAFARASFEPVR